MRCTLIHGKRLAAPQHAPLRSQAFPTTLQKSVKGVLPFSTFTLTHWAHVSIARSPVRMPPAAAAGAPSGGMPARPRPPRGRGAASLDDLPCRDVSPGRRLPCLKARGDGGTDPRPAGDSRCSAPEPLRASLRRFRRRRMRAPPMLRGRTCRRQSQHHWQDAPNAKRQRRGGPPAPGAATGCRCGSRQGRRSPHAAGAAHRAPNASAGCDS